MTCGNAWWACCNGLWRLRWGCGCPWEGGLYVHRCTERVFNPLWGMRMEVLQNTAESNIVGGVRGRWISFDKSRGCPPGICSRLLPGQPRTQRCRDCSHVRRGERASNFLTGGSLDTCIIWFSPYCIVWLGPPASGWLDSITLHFACGGVDNDLLKWLRWKYWQSLDPDIST